MTVQSVHDLAERPNQRVNHGYAFVMLFWGALTVVSGVVYTIWDPAISWVYWAIAGPVGGALTAGYFARRSIRLGIRGKHIWAYPVIGLGITVSAFAVATLAPPLWIMPAIAIAVGVGNLLFGVLSHYSAVTVAGLGMVALGLAGGLGGLESAPLLFILGGYYALTGLALRADSSR
ncbi:MAG: hypothetical protein ACK5MT_10755 [Actinomycetales bacterium]